MTSNISSRCSHYMQKLTSVFIFNNDKLPGLVSGLRCGRPGGERPRSASRPAPTGAAAASRAAGPVAAPALVARRPAAAAKVEPAAPRAPAGRLPRYARRLCRRP